MPEAASSVFSPAVPTPAPASAPPLPAAPLSLVGEDGAPRFGLYRGALANGSFSGLRGDYLATVLQRRVIEKKWQYAFLATPDVMLSIALIDTGYLASGICAIFDRGSRRMLMNENPVLPSPCVQLSDTPGDGLHARLLGPRLRARIEQSAGRMLITARWGHASIDLALDTRHAPEPVTAIAPVEGQGRFDFTQKRVLIPAEGEIRSGNLRFPVQGELASLDYTHGYLARETAWRWAFAAGRQGKRQVAFNFSEGFLQGAGENVVWVDGEPRPVGRVSFSFDGSAPLAPWRLRSDDGTLELVFQPEGFRAQAVDLGLILSKYLQPFGSFKGHLPGPSGERVAIDGLPGVAEDHAARW